PSWSTPTAATVRTSSIPSGSLGMCAASSSDSRSAYTHDTGEGGSVAGLIRPEDVQAVKERSSIEDVVREHVTLRPGGTGSLKGLCPFHDEKTPSFNVRPAVGAWHCFGCGEGGDVISFIMQIDHLTFSEAVERLAAKLG